MRRQRLVVALLAVTLGARPLWAAGNEKAECATAAETAEKLREEKHFQRAREGLLRCSRETCPKIVQRDCLKSLAELEQSQPTVVVRARDREGRDVLDVETSVDGVSMGKKLDGRGWPLDPGPHELVLDGAASGFVVARQTLVIAEGEKNRVVAITLERPTPAAPPPPLASVASSAPPPAVVGASRSALPYVTGAIGVAGLLTFGVLELVAHARYDDLRGTCGVGGTCASSDVDALRTRYVISGIALGVGVVGVATSAVLFATSRDTAVGTSASRDSVSASLRVRF